MVKFYVTQIRLKKITLSEVSEKWRSAVEKALKEQEEKSE
jgi:hypothetical protein